MAPAESYGEGNARVVLAWLRIAALFIFTLSSYGGRSLNGAKHCDLKMTPVTATYGTAHSDWIPEDPINNQKTTDTFNHGSKLHDQ